MKILSALVLALSITFSSVQAQSEKVWDHVLTYGQGKFAVHVPSIIHKEDGFMYFTMKVVYEPALVIGGTHVTSLTTNNKGNCGSRESQVVNDSSFSVDGEVMSLRDIVSKGDTLSAVDEGAAHGIILKRYCKTSV